MRFKLYTFLVLMGIFNVSLASTFGKYFQLESDGFERQYFLYNFEGSVKKPLVIVLHGNYNNGEIASTKYGFNNYALKYDFMVAYPDSFRSKEFGYAISWNDGRETLESNYLGINDVKFIENMVRDINKKTPINFQQIYITGDANGGMMAYRLGCQLHGLFAAIAPINANIPKELKESCIPETGLSILTINENDDDVVPISGGEICDGVQKLFCEGGSVLSKKESTDFFIKANGCKLKTKQDNQIFTQRNYFCEHGNVQSINVLKKTYVWEKNQNDNLNVKFNTTEKIIKFFLNIKR